MSVNTALKWIDSVAFPGTLLDRLCGLTRLDTKCAVMHLGSDYGGWCIHPERLSAASVVYSFGVGEDVSFDLALIEQFGLSVHAFDPTPRVIQWVEEQSLPPQLHYHPFGIAEFSGTAMFYPPAKPTNVSHSMLNRRRSGAGHVLELPVYTLQAIMEKLGHERVDLLKMDIEGAEYAMIENALAGSVQVDQWLIEFHHRFRRVGRQRTKTALETLREAGFEVFHVSSDATDFSMLRRAPESEIGIIR